jgi:hypothetical protein
VRLEYRNTDGWVAASVVDDGRATLAHRDAERTAAEFAHAEDRSAYLAMLQAPSRRSSAYVTLSASESLSKQIVIFFSKGGLLWCLHFNE